MLQFQTIASKIADNLDYQKEDEFVQTPHDAAVGDFLETMTSNGCEIQQIIPSITNDYLITTISYVEKDKVSKIIQAKPTLAIPSIPHE